MSCAATSLGLTLPSAVKFSRITATTRLMNTNVAMTVKNGSANVEPQSLCGNASGSQPRASSIIASDMNADQPSPVRHWKSSSIDAPNDSKLTRSESA